MPPPKPKVDSGVRAVVAALLSWLLPGLGHWYLGHKRFAAAFCVAICAPYLAGVLIGGVKTSVNPHSNPWLFLAEMGAGGLTTSFYVLNNMVGDVSAAEAGSIITRDPEFSRLSPEQRSTMQANLDPYIADYPAVDIAQIYLSVAGIMNLIVILDSLVRGQKRGLPVFYHELPTEQQVPIEGRT